MVKLGEKYINCHVTQEIWIVYFYMYCKYNDIGWICIQWTDARKAGWWGPKSWKAEVINEQFYTKYEMKVKCLLGINGV